MATVYKEFIVEADAAHVWDALRDFGAVHTRLAPGFLTGCTIDAEGARILTFANGLVAREVLVGIDDAHRRLAYTVTGGQAAHHHATAQVFEEGAGRSRFVWITDVLPDAMAAYIGPMMEQGGAAMKATLEGRTVSAAA
ncbi:Polyketide cyclase / dehydrase and lipid transport [Variovorax sp. YR634]|jgi:carbon monoxide dehydrogenase subunit G|uniref:SRPBCC family protein n=1 Tax=unclassified Variovorax TaxID=663243 RepID=UPI000896EAFE|nr:MULTISPECIES: SRPBCC family protein [unclassified Variovorax]SDX50337.1 Polyketide cyclase / dehydrase and lipid transport [Variovorax sp. YR634]SOD28427.1 Polyketide cyclase / dehydrase and lipid transport [Variovorax sp. YR752]